MVILTKLKAEGRCRSGSLYPRAKAETTQASEVWAAPKSASIPGSSASERSGGATVWLKVAVGCWGPWWIFWLSVNSFNNYNFVHCKLQKCDTFRNVLAPSCLDWFCTPFKVWLSWLLCSRLNELSNCHSLVRTQLSKVCVAFVNVPFPSRDVEVEQK